MKIFKSRKGIAFDMVAKAIIFLIVVAAVAFVFYALFTGAAGELFRLTACAENTMECKGNAEMICLGGKWQVYQECGPGKVCGESKYGTINCLAACTGGLLEGESICGTSEQCRIAACAPGGEEVLRETCELRCTDKGTLCSNPCGSGCEDGRCKHYINCFETCENDEGCLCKAGCIEKEEKWISNGETCGKSVACADSEGIDVAKKGYVTGNWGPFIHPSEEVNSGAAGTFEDVCNDGNVLTEMYCSTQDEKGVMQAWVVPLETYCPGFGYTGCSDGACVGGPGLQCTDTEAGLNYEQVGFVTGRYMLPGMTATYELSNEPDSCRDSNTLDEYYCLNGEGYATVKAVSCTSLGYTGGCQEGKCVR